MEGRLGVLYDLHPTSTLSSVRRPRQALAESGPQRLGPLSSDSKTIVPLPLSPPPSILTPVASDETGRLLPRAAQSHYAGSSSPLLAVADRDADNHCVHGGSFLMAHSRPYPPVRVGGNRSHRDAVSAAAVVRAGAACARISTLSMTSPTPTARRLRGPPLGLRTPSPAKSVRP